MEKFFDAESHYEDITQVLRGIGTYKRLEAAVPELVKYVQKTEAGLVERMAKTEQIGRVRSLLRREAVNG
jgi:hypothetical protein